MNCDLHKKCSHEFLMVQKQGNSWATLRCFFCWNLPVLGAFMTNCTTVCQVSTCLHSESIWINLQVCLYENQGTHTKIWEFEAVWFEYLQCGCIFFSKLRAPKMQCFFHYQSHNFLCNFAAFLVWCISILYTAHTAPKKLQMNKSMQTHRLFSC